MVYYIKCTGYIRFFVPLFYKLDNGETVVVRPSGTEPKIKIYYTTLGKNLEEAEAEKEKLAEALKPIMA